MASTISTVEMHRIVEKLKKDRVRDSTKNNYYTVWKSFNKFFLRLDVKPNTWEERLVLYAGFLVNDNKQSQMVRSYICAIKNILRDDGVHINEDKFLLTSLTKACKLRNDRVITRLPMQKGLLQLLLNSIIQLYEVESTQPYLATLYSAFFTTMYFGMFRIGELVASQHVIKVKDVQLAGNKNKIMFILWTSKTHGLGAKPQRVKITSSRQIENSPRCRREYTANLCSFHMLHHYLAIRPKYDSVTEQFFVFRDRSPLKPEVVRAILKD